MHNILFLRHLKIGWLKQDELDKRIHKESQAKGQPPQRYGPEIGTDNGIRFRSGITLVLPWQWFCDGLPAEFDTDEQLSEHNRQEDPGLATELVATRIIQKLERLTEAHCSPKEQKEQSESIEPMLRREPQDIFQVEGVQLGDEEH